MSFSLRPNKSSINYAGSFIDIAIVGMIYIFAQIVVATILLMMGLNSPEQLTEKPLVVLNAYICAGVATVALTVALMRLRKVSFSILKFRRYRWGDLGYAVAGYFGYMFIALFVSSIMRLIPGVDIDQEQDLGLGTITSSLLPLVFVALVVIPPLAEEILFRGFLYGRLKYHKISSIFAALVTSLAFGIVHGQLNVGVDTFMLSMVMIYMYEKRQNLWVTITMHALKNTVAFLALFVFKIV